MQDFSFSAEDLKANRAGKFSQAQRAALEQKRRTALIQVGACLVFFLIALGITYYVLAAPDGLHHIHPVIELLGFTFLLMIGVPYAT